MLEQGNRIMFKSKAFFAVFLLSLGSFAGAGLAFFMQVLLARSLGTETFGLFSSLLAMVVLVTPLAGFGVSQLWLKYFGEEGWEAQKYLLSSFRFVLLSTIIVLIGLFLWAFISQDSTQKQTLFFLLSFYLVGQVSLELVSAKLQLEERYTALSLWQFTAHFLRFILVAGVLFFSTSENLVQKVAIAYLLVALFLFFIAILSLKEMRKTSFKLKGHGENPKAMTSDKTSSINMQTIIQGSWAFGLASFFHLIYFQSDIILVQYIKGDTEAGIYSVAFTIMVAVYMFPAVLYQKFLLPKLHRWAKHKPDTFVKVFNIGNKAMLVLGVFAMLLLWLLSSWGVLFLFGESYYKAIELVNILALSAPIIFVAFSAGATLVTATHIKRKVKYMGSIALLNIVLNLLLIPDFGAVGASIATVTSNLFLLMLYYRGAKRYVFKSHKGKK